MTDREEAMEEAETRPEEPMVIKKIRFPQDDFDELNQIARRDERSINWLVRKAVREFLERERAK